MRIIVTKSFGFRRPNAAELKDKQVDTLLRVNLNGERMVEADVPEWVKDDPIFVLGVKEKSIRVLQKEAAEVKEDAFGKKEKAKVPPPAK